MPFRTLWWFTLIFLFLSLSACNLIRTPEALQPPPPIPTEAIVPTGEALQVTATHGQPAISTVVPLSEPATAAPTTEAVASPLPENPPTQVAPVGPTLAFLRDGDIWLLDQPGLEPYPLTIAGDIKGFTWSPDGRRLAAFNGHTLCFYNRDGSVTTACLDLGLSNDQAAIERRLVLSPDQRYIVLWNPINPQDEGAIGWMIVALDTTNIMYRIEDPVDWGADLTPENDPGGFTGQPVFLNDNRLIGTLSHRALCGSGGCHYRLYQFDMQNRTFVPFDNKPEEGFSEGLSLDLSQDGSQLANYGTFFAGCDSFVTFLDTYDLASGTRQVFNLDGVSQAGMAFNPNMDQAVLARTAGCNSPNVQSWATACGLTQGDDILPMQSWKFDTEDRQDLIPGVTPTWSPDGNWVSFRSCLARNGAGSWQPSESASPSLYLFNPSAPGEILDLQGGTLPEWQP